MLNNIKHLKNDKGFTIVELLIVIVVIAILAAITIVAYNGIQTRAKTTAGQSLATTIVKKLEAYNGIVGSYPTTKTQIQSIDVSKIDALPAALTAGTSPLVVPATDTIVSPATPALTSGTANGGQSVRIYPGTATGGKVIYFNYDTGLEVQVSYGAGA